MKRTCLVILFLVIVVATSSCSAEESPVPSPSEEQACSDCVIESAQVGEGFIALPFIGDLWATTWADDNRLYSAFGDGTGMTKCLPTLLPDEPDEFDTEYTEVTPGRYLPPNEDNEYCEVFGCAEPLPLCPYTPVGLIALPEVEISRLGTIDLLHTPPCDGPDQCIVSRHIPYGDYTVFEHSDKPSSLLFVNGHLVMHLHYPPGEPTHGYLAYSDDYGRTWTLLPGSPWEGDSPFKVMMFINMGKAYTLNQDGYVYALGIRNELGDPPRTQEVYLARAPVENMLDYTAYQYFAGLQEDGSPRWAPDPEAALPVPGLHTMAQSAAMYHPGIGRYIFLSGLLRDDGTGGLFEAPTPWGPWHLSATFPAGFIPGLIPKETGTDSFYFTAAGGGNVTYNLNVGQIKLHLREKTSP